MCGYLRREPKAMTNTAYLEAAGLEKFIDYVDVPDGTQHFLPAFAQRGERKIADVIINEDGKLKTVDATWWYDCRESEGHLIPSGTKSFNARRLHLDMWKDAIEHRRGVAVMTGIGESREVEGKKTADHYLMIADQPFFIGTLYKRHSHNLYSAALITREKQIGFDRFHDKAFPLFLPYDKQFIELWLDPDTSSNHPEIKHLLEHPTWFTDLHVTRVKTFTKGETFKTSVTETLKAA